MQTAATTSHAAFTASPRLSATIAKATAPSRAMAIHNSAKICLPLVITTNSDFVFTSGQERQFHSIRINPLIEPAPVFGHIADAPYHANRRHNQPICCAAQLGSHSLMWRIFRCGIMHAATVGDRPRVRVGNAQAPFRVARYSARDDARSTGENKIQTGSSEKTAVQPVHR